MTKPIFINLLKLFLITRVGLLAFSYLFYELVPLDIGSIKANYISSVSSTKIGNLLIPWDGQWILDISQNWYPRQVSNPMDSAKYVQMPLYPLLIRLITPITSSYITSGFIINMVASFLGIIYLFKVLIKDYSLEIVKSTILFFLLNPLTIFFLAIYTESLFFCLSILTFYFLREKKYHLTAFFAIASTLTKSTGMLLTILLAIELIPEIKRKKALLVIPLTPVITFFLYGILIQIYSGASNFYVTGQQIFGRSNPSILNVFITLSDSLRHFFEFPIHGIFYSKLDTTVILSIFLLTIIALKIKMRLSYALYPILIVLLTLSSGTTTAIMRYVSISFPIYLALAILSKNHPHLRMSLIYCFLLMQALFALLYTHWYWVA